MPAELLIDPLTAPAPASRGPSILERLRAHFALKLALFALLTLAFCIPYYLIGYYPLRTPAMLPLTFVDRAIAFNPAWVYVYESLFLMIPLAPFFAAARRQLWLYTSGFLLVTGVGLAICLAFPTLCPRPAQTASVEPSGLYAWVAAVDPATNAFPSMHIAFAAQSLFFGIWMLREEAVPHYRLLVAVGVTWVLAIAYSTLVTKQHYALDLPAGALLAYACHCFAFRWKIR